MIGSNNHKNSQLEESGNNNNKKMKHGGDSDGVLYDYFAIELILYY